MAYWVYENWRAQGQRATVHGAECSNCKDGEGQRGGTRRDNGRWHRPFRTIDDALRQAAVCGGEKRRCATCNP